MKIESLREVADLVLSHLNYCEGGWDVHRVVLQTLQGQAIHKTGHYVIDEEVAALAIDWLKTEKKIVELRSKGNKFRYLSLPDGYLVAQAKEFGLK